MELKLTDAASFDWKNMGHHKDHDLDRAKEIQHAIVWSSLVKPNHPMLKTKLEPFDFDNPPTDPEMLFANMSQMMIEKKGVGLSANQVGLPYRMFVMGDEENLISVFNPRIVDYEGEEYYAEEGCLTYPGLYVKIKRHNIIRARFTTHDGTTDTIKLSGMTSRIFQHEYDHLEGINYQKRASYYHLEKAKKDQKKLKRLRKRVDNGAGMR